MSDTGRQIGDCHHGRARDWCVLCLRNQVVHANDIATERLDLLNKAKVAYEDAHAAGRKQGLEEAATVADQYGLGHCIAQDIRRLAEGAT